MIRLGLIIPSSNTTIESEFRRFLRHDFSLHVARLSLSKITVKELSGMERKIEEEARKLADAHVKVIGYGCTSGSLFKGLGHDKIIEQRIERAFGIPAVATAGAVVKALKALRINKVAVATPYTREINMLEEKFLSDNGFNVVDLKGLGITDNISVGRLSNKVVYNLTKRLRIDDADGIFLSCTNLPTMEIIGRLEKTFRKPFISSNTATLWAMLRQCHRSTKILGFGKLLARI